MKKLFNHESLMPKSIDIPMPQDAVDIPHSADEILTQYQAEKEWRSPAVSGNAAMFQ